MCSSTFPKYGCNLAGNERTAVILLETNDFPRACQLRLKWPQPRSNLAKDVSGRRWLVTVSKHSQKIHWFIRIHFLLLHEYVVLCGGDMRQTLCDWFVMAEHSKSSLTTTTTHIDRWASGSEQSWHALAGVDFLPQPRAGQYQRVAPCVITWARWPPHQHILD